MLALGFVFASVTYLTKAVPPELNAYVRRPDPTFSWAVGQPVFSHQRILLTSQTWHRVVWRHSLVISPVAKPESRDTAIIYITGDEPNKADTADADTVSREARLPVAMLYNIPVQPIGGLQEDELIAHTFEKYLATGDASWPLLFPMAKSVIRTMDALQSWSHGRLKRFVLMGESKRAWTAWMAAATGDRRIIGIAPCAYDNLNVAAQMKHQMAIWGHYSPAIEAYTKRGLQETLSTVSGKRLGQIIDPYSYLPAIKARILTVRGSNDPYWAPDAYSLYSAALPPGSSLLILPNEGHDFKDKRLYFATVAAFADSCAANASWPSVSMRRFRDISFFAKTDRMPKFVRLYSTNSKNQDFAGSHWAERQSLRGNSARKFHFAFPAVQEGYESLFAQASFALVIRGHRHSVFLSSSPLLLKVDNN